LGHFGSFLVKSVDNFVDNFSLFLTN